MSSILDNQSALVAHDPFKMGDLTRDFADQCRRALEIARNASLPKTAASPDLVMLTGLGGSAAGGDLVAALMAGEGKVPFLVNREYTLPRFVGQGSLIIAASFSGNTEETLSAYDDAKRRGANIICISSGGKLIEKAKADGFPHVIVPGGQPPRTAMGYMMIPVVVVLENLGLIGPQDFEAAFAAIDEIREENYYDVNIDSNPAKQLASALSGSFATLYGCSSWTYALAQRWRAQINENGKEMVLTHYFPELCHNEILGWQGAHEQGVESWHTVILEGGDESERMMKRVAFTMEEIGDITTVHRVRARGDSLLGRLLSLSHFGDYVSLYLAALRGRDPGEIVAIDGLKNKLAQLDES